jgi:hypothetical protein
VLTWDKKLLTGISPVRAHAQPGAGGTDTLFCVAPIVGTDRHRLAGYPAPQARRDA